MNTPFPGMTINISNQTELSYLNTFREKVDIRNQQKPVSVFEYEDRKNNELQKIKILKPQYLGVFINDMRDIMKYDKSTDYINSNTKKVYNPKVTGV